MRKRRARKGWRWRVGTLLVAVLTAASVIPPARSQAPAQPTLPAGSKQAARAKVAIETDTAPIEELVVLVESAEQTNDLPEAARLYERILEQRPDWAAVKLNLGLVYHSQQHYLEAVRILSEVVEQDPELRSAMLFLGASYYNLDRYAEAVPLLERYLSLEPASDEARPFLAASYFALNEYQASALQYLRQISLTPGNAALYFHLGEAYSAMAASLVRRLEDESSDSAAASGNSGYYRILAAVQQSLDEKNYALAESRLGEALALDPEDSEGRLAYGYYRLANGDLAAAKTDFEAILGNQPGHCRALQGLVDVGMGLEDQAGLAEAVRRLLAVWPACLTYTVKDSDQELQTDFSGSDAARTKCRQAVAKRSFPADAAGRVERTLVMASCLEIQGAVPAATAALLSMLPESPRGRYLSFQILLRLAQRAYRQSARLKPNSPLLAGLRAREFERQGNLESADAAYRNTLLVTGSDPGRSWHTLNSRRGSAESTKRRRCSSRFCRRFPITRAPTRCWLMSSCPSIEPRMPSRYSAALSTSTPATSRRAANSRPPSMKAGNSMRRSSFWKPLLPTPTVRSTFFSVTCTAGKGKGKRRSTPYASISNVGGRRKPSQ